VCFAFRITVKEQLFMPLIGIAFSVPWMIDFVRNFHQYAMAGW